jgi:hypothetical protein
MNTPPANPANPAVPVSDELLAAEYDGRIVNLLNVVCLLDACLRLAPDGPIADNLTVLRADVGRVLADLLLERQLLTSEATTTH